MRKKILSVKDLIQFIKFGMVGVSNSIISYCTYAGLVYLGCYYIIANCVSFLVGTLNSYFWNNRFVFKLQENEKRNHFLSFFKMMSSYAFTGLFLNNIFSFFLIEKISISKYIAPILISVLLIPINYLLNKFWAMRTSKEK